MLKRQLHRVKILACIGLVTAFLGCEATSNTASTGQNLDDTVITTKAKAAIFAEPNLKTLQIDIKTFKGVVQLSGFVDSLQSAKKAGEIVRDVPGITEVKNDLVVK